MPRWFALVLLPLGTLLTLWPLSQSLRIYLVMKPFGGIPEPSLFIMTNARLLLSWAIEFVAGVFALIVAIRLIERRA
jgi:hypothetical protein